MTTISFRRGALIAYALILVTIVLTAIILPTILKSNDRAHRRVLSDLQEIENANQPLPTRRARK